MQGVRVLIVDDNVTNCALLHRRLAAWGMRPDAANDDPSALALLQSAFQNDDPFALALVDMLMPGMDGEALCRAIQAGSRLAGTQVVMMAALFTPGAVQRPEAVGCAAYLTKPVPHYHLRRVLTTILGTPPPASAANQASQATGVADTLATPPSSLASLPSSASLGATGNGAKSGARILLVEDNLTNQKVAMGILKKLGFRADAVANGAEAVRTLETIPYDLVLMDVQMPVMDGLEATRRIRSAEAAVLNRAIPIIAMTAEVMQGDREKCLAAGMNDYVTRPVIALALDERIRRWLGQR